MKPIDCIFYVILNDKVNRVSIMELQIKVAS